MRFDSLFIFLYLKRVIIFVAFTAEKDTGLRRLNNIYRGIQFLPGAELSEPSLFE